MDSRELTHEEEERRRQRRREWAIEQELQRKHEERKAMMIEAFEKQLRAERSNVKNKSRRSKSASPHRSTSCKRSEEYINKFT